MEVLISPIVNVYQIITIAVGLTAVTFIALILLLDKRIEPEPLILPAKE